MDRMKEANKAIAAYVLKDMPKRIERFGRLASWDLWSGPMTYCEECGADNLDACTCENKYPGFVEACQEVSRYLQDCVSTLYYDEESGDISTVEPEGEVIENDDGEEEWIEPMPYFQYDWKDTARALFGKDLVEYL